MHVCACAQINSVMAAINPIMAFVSGTQAAKTLKDVDDVADVAKNAGSKVCPVACGGCCGVLLCVLAAPCGPPCSRCRCALHSHSGGATPFCHNTLCCVVDLVCCGAVL